MRGSQTAAAEAGASGVQVQTSRARWMALLTLGLFATVVVIALTWAKWLPYLAKLVHVAGAGVHPGHSILAKAGRVGAAPSLSHAWSFTVAYGRSVWVALLAALVISSAIEALLPRRWLVRALSGNGRWATLRGGAASLPTMMCTCCAAELTGDPAPRGRLDLLGAGLLGWQPDAEPGGAGLPRDRRAVAVGGCTAGPRRSARVRLDRRGGPAGRAQAGARRAPARLVRGRPGVGGGCAHALRQGVRAAVGDARPRVPAGGDRGRAAARLAFPVPRLGGALGHPGGAAGGGGRNAAGDPHGRRDPDPAGSGGESASAPV